MAVDTLQDLMDRVRARTDTETDPHITDATLIGFINSAKHEGEGLYISALGEDNYATSCTFSTVNGVSNYSLSTITGGTFYRALWLDQTLSNGNKADVPNYSNKQRNTYKNTSNFYSPLYNNATYRYKLHGGNLTLVPTPNGVTLMELEFVQVQPNLSLTTDTFEDPNGELSEFIVTRASIYVKIKKQESSGELQTDLERQRQRIKDMAPNRDQGQPFKVVEVDDCNPYWRRR